MEDRLQQNLLFSCVHHEKFGTEQLIVQHALSVVVSGKMDIMLTEGTHVAGEGMMGILRRNTLLKTKKHPAEDGRPFKSFTLFLTEELLRAYSLQNNEPSQERFKGSSLYEIPQQSIMKGFFQSITPYFDRPDYFTPKMAELKTYEAIELLLQIDPSIRQFLFDFNEPHKLDLEGFMMKNFLFNIPLAEFARLTGRSLSTFKRDFSHVFDDSPEKWLRKRRLSEAHTLLKQQKHKPSDVYLHVGFENFSHFSTAFKREFGYNPSTVGR
ncbi:MAG: helix-turn-helix domain-containing protein [Bacteroidota bacterium]